MGDTVLGRSMKAIYKGIKSHNVKDKDKWIVFPNTHEALISREDFQKVQDILQAASEARQTSMQKTEEIRATLVNLFEGKIVCADCGKKMYFHRKRIDKDKRKRWYAFYECSTSVGRRYEHYLESTIGGCYLALSDDYLFIFKLNTPSFAADETSERQGYIARCDLDGADRQILTKLAANESIVSGCVACDGENLYYLSCLLQDDGTTTPSTLIQLKIADGTRREICQLDSESRHFIVGAHQDKIILKSILNPARLSDDLSAEDIVRAVQEQVHQLTLLSSDGQQQELCRWKQDERSEMFMNGNMYYWDKETNGLYCWDLESDTPECLFAGPIRFDDEVSYDRLSLSADSFDGHLLVTAVQDSDGQAVSCAFDPISKSLQKLTLTSDDEKSVLILAEGSEYFLVRYGLMEYEVPDYAPDGREITTTMLLPNLRLIAKSDYWNNIPNYILLDDYVYSRKP